MSETYRTRTDDGSFHKHGCVSKNVHANMKTDRGHIKIYFTRHNVLYEYIRTGLHKPQLNIKCKLIPCTFQVILRAN